MEELGAAARKRSLITRILAFLATPPPPPRRHFSKHWRRPGNHKPGF